MGIDLSKFKVLYKNRVFNAVALQNIIYSDETNIDDQYKTPKFIEVLVINEDGNIIAIYDEAWSFQFFPIMNKTF